MKRSRSKTEEHAKRTKNSVLNTISDLQEKITRMANDQTYAVDKTVEDCFFLFLDLYQRNRALTEQTQETVKQAVEPQKGLDGAVIQAQETLYERDYHHRFIKAQEKENAQLDQILHERTGCLINNTIDYNTVLKNLEIELRDRIGLQSQLISAQEELKSVENDAQQNLELFKSFNAKINKFSEAARSLREELQLQDAVRNMPKNATVDALPPPLYKLYHLISIYNEVYRQHNVIKLRVLGDLADATQATMEETLKYAYQKHPLSLEWAFTFKNHKKIVLVVEYLVNLKIAILSTSKGATSAPFTDDNSLVGLFEGDDGETSPNFANQYIFGRNDFQDIYAQNVQERSTAFGLVNPSRTSSSSIEV